MKKEIIYPRVVVYKNLLPQAKQYTDLLKFSRTQPANFIFKNWEDWYGFGDFMNIGMPDNPEQVDIPDIATLDINDKYAQQQIDFVKTISKIFYDTTEDYKKEYNVELPNWVHAGISICKYDETPSNHRYAMHYHTDYRGADADSPGNKFAITCTIYLNDDYDGGGLKFLREDTGDIIDYKPEAGDVVVFPSGDPITGASHYFHGVDKITNGEKYFIRCFWMYNFEGTKEWHENEKKYGKDEWAKIYDEQMVKSIKSGKWHRYVVEPGEEDPKLSFSTPFFRKIKNDN